MPPNGKIYSEAGAIITHTRSGGTFLANCLSNHPQIFCPRGEPLLRGMEWGTAFSEASAVQIIDCITSAAFYKVGMCKITYDQTSKQVFNYLSKRRAKVIHLARENLLRVAVSQAITGMVASGQLGHAAHSFESLDPPTIHMNPREVIGRCKFMWDRIRKMQNMLSAYKFTVLYVSYADMVGGEGSEATAIATPIAESICDFLGVERRELYGCLKRVNKAPLSKLVENWDQVKAAVEGTVYKVYLEDEDIWTS